MKFMDPLTPAQQLEGYQLENGWIVLPLVQKKPNATGGFFSAGYLVRHKTGKEAFLKALDFSEAFASADVTGEMEKLTRTYNFERDLLILCKDKNLNRVVRALDHGTILVEGIPVPYLIFELANGDIRSHIDSFQDIDLAWTLRMLHQASVGISQLHGVKITHQDLKPSNVLVFGEKTAKIADLGRAAHPDHKPPHYNNMVPGDYTYAPPEQKYRYLHPDEDLRKLAADAYQLGNIILFSFTGLTMTAKIFEEMSLEHMPKFGGMSYQEVLPFIQLAFNAALEKVAQYIPDPVREDIILIIRQLCEPDIERRGRRFNRKNFSLQPVQPPFVIPIEWREICCFPFLI